MPLSAAVDDSNIITKINIHIVVVVRLHNRIYAIHAMCITHDPSAFMVMYRLKVWSVWTARQSLIIIIIFAPQS